MNTANLLTDKKLVSFLYYRCYIRTSLSKASNGRSIIPLIQTLEISDQSKALLALEPWTQPSMISASMVAAGVTAKTKKPKKLSHSETKV